MLQEKVDAAVGLIQEVVEEHVNPVVMSSFGKDSMVLLDLVKRAGFRLPILFFKEPYFPRKYHFANQVIEANDYVVYDYPPLETAFFKRNGKVEVYNFYQSVNKPIGLPTGIKVPKAGEDYLCALSALYGKPTGTYDFQWDAAFIGHKATDVDPLLGPVPIHNDRVEAPEELHLAFPLRSFTDADIWEYHLENHLPINRQRYNEADNWREFDDVTYNPDYFPACTACMDLDQGIKVYCPKVGAMVESVSSQLRDMNNTSLPAYMTEVEVK